MMACALWGGSGFVCFCMCLLGWSLWMLAWVYFFLFPGQLAPWPNRLVLSFRSVNLSGEHVDVGDDDRWMMLALV